MADRVSLLEKRLSVAIGEEVWSRSGLGPSIDVEDLRRQITPPTRRYPFHYSR